MRKKVQVCILDGWGLGKNNPHNAIFLAKKKNFDYLTKKYGYLKLKASENDVGLPAGQFGNSEVGHTNIGAGRIILQDVMRISESFGNGEIKNKSAITNILENCKNKKNIFNNKYFRKVQKDSHLGFNLKRRRSWASRSSF